MEFWGLSVAPGSFGAVFTVPLETQLRLTQAALAHTRLADERVVLTVRVDRGPPHVLGTLKKDTLCLHSIPDIQDQLAFRDTKFAAQDQVHFSHSGSQPLDLVGILHSTEEYDADDSESDQEWPDATEDEVGEASDDSDSLDEVPKLVPIRWGSGAAADSLQEGLPRHLVPSTEAAAAKNMGSSSGGSARDDETDGQSDESEIGFRMVRHPVTQEVVVDVGSSDEEASCWGGKGERQGHSIPRRGTDRGSRRGGPHGGAERVEGAYVGLKAGRQGCERGRGGWSKETRTDGFVDGNKSRKRQYRPRGKGDEHGKRRGGPLPGGYRGRAGRGRLLARGGFQGSGGRREDIETN